MTKPMKISDLMASVGAAQGRITRRAMPDERVLIPIEDGQPVCGFSMENLNIPKDHLAATANAIEQSGKVQLAAIGVQHDVSAFYKKSVRVDHPEQMPRALSGLLDLLLVQPNRGNDPRAFKRLQLALTRQSDKLTATQKSL